SAATSCQASGGRSVRLIDSRSRLCSRGVRGLTLSGTPYTRPAPEAAPGAPLSAATPATRADNPIELRLRNVLRFMESLLVSARRPSRAEPDTRRSPCRCRGRVLRGGGEARIGAPFERPHHLIAEHHLRDLLEVMLLQ